MKTKPLKPAASIALALALALAGSGGAGAMSCTDNPAEIQSLISQGAIISQYDAVAAAGYSVDDLLTYKLCEDGGRYQWVVGLLSADGAAQSLTLNAQ